MEFYPFLVKSYVEQAISNYVKPIILNYHNQYSSLSEVEEIYYELTNSVIYKVKRSKAHPCWKTNNETMLRDRMYYDFKDSKFEEIEPAFLMGPEPPMLCRALRYGVTLKLEDLYTYYLTGIDQVVHKIKNAPIEFEEYERSLLDISADEEVKFDHEKENEALSPVKRISDAVMSEDNPDVLATPTKSPFKTPTKLETIFRTTAEITCLLVSTENFHYKECVRVETARKRINENRNQAKKELTMLIELFKIKLSEFEYDQRNNVDKSNSTFIIYSFVYPRIREFS